MQFVFDVVVISFTSIIWFGILSSIYDWFVCQYKVKNMENDDTEVGLSPLTLEEMHASRQLHEGKEITAEWAPVRKEKLTYISEIFCSILFLFIACCVVASLSSEATSSLRYMYHVDKICSHVSSTKRGYHHGVYSNHPRLVRGLGKDVPKAKRIANAKKLCGHD